MKWKKEQVVLVAIIIILAAYLLIHRSGRTHYTLPAPGRIEKSGITRLELGKPGSETGLVKKDGRWVIEPQGYPADPNVVDDMLEKIAGLTLSALVSENENLAVYGLDPEHRVEVRAFAGDKPLRSFLVGKTAPSGRHTFVKLDREKGIFHAEGDLRSAFDASVPRLRDRTVMKIDEDVKSLVFTNGKRKLTIVAAVSPAANEKKDASGPGNAGSRWRTEAGKPANDREVDGLISTLRNLACDGFIEGKKKTDFARPVYTVTLAGTKTYTLSLYREKGNSFAGVSSGSDYPFRLSDWRAKQIMKEFAVLTGAK